MSTATMTSSEITPEIVADHGLNGEEYDRLLAGLGRIPNLLELGIYSVMWSEHCSYKSSRLHLSKLPTTGRQVICGPGENAGVIDIGDGDVCIFKMESHNHPSFIEPYQGAATGVGGILRDVFTMGARPVALMNALRFGAADHPKTRHLVSGVVAGIGGYGNCVGVPTVGGETNFDPAYNGNILVNAMAIGIAKADKIFYSAASGVGNPVIYVGAKTGRDGIHGATMASAEFSDDAEEKRPTVQVGDPFVEKLLIEACLELMATDAIVAIQDMGAAGLTSSSVEMASKGAVGFRLDLDKVPQRETGMTPYEMMLSESQERMLMVLKPGKEAQARAIFEKWGLDFAVIGELVEGNNLTLVHGGAVVADIPVPPLVDDAPKYDRPHVPTAVAAEPVFTSVTSQQDALLTLISSPNLCSRRWIWEQYDHQVMADTAAGPGGDAAIVRVHGTRKGLVISTDVTPRYCKADPVTGGMQAVAETWRNIVAAGGTPLAITNCLNFGNPERPEIMGQFVGCLDGMGAACRALDYPVVSGNVSLYNETDGQAILPTPAIGGVGLIGDVANRTSWQATSGQALLLIGPQSDTLAQSLFARDILGEMDGPAPVVDLDMERRAGTLIMSLIADHGVRCVHDLSDGGLALALADIALASDAGLSVDITGSGAPDFTLFAEGQSRYLLAVDADMVDKIQALAAAAAVPAQLIGTVGTPDSMLTVAGSDIDVSVAALRTAFERTLPDLMA